MSPELVRRWGLVAALAGSLAACGGGGGNSGINNNPPPPPPPPPPGTARGTVISASQVGMFTRAQIDGQTAISASLVNDHATCDVAVVSVQYATIDPKGNSAT